MIVPVILSGGSGSRLWPLSRPQQPKQLLAMVDERTMLRATFDRLSGIADVADPLVVCNADHHHLVAAELGAAGFDPDRIVLEPVGRNTAPAIAAAALVLTEGDDDPILLVLPADHIIRDEEAFRAAVATGARHAATGSLVTFGIVPDYPETGYGYIRAGDAIEDRVSVLAEFVEKPDVATAEGYIESGNFRWNSGMFMFRATRYLDELTTANPAMVDAATEAVSAADRRRGVRLDPAAFTRSPADSIDFAVMEGTTAGVVVSLDAGWSDVGSWAALWEVTEQDDHGNVVVGDVAAIDTSGSYLRSEDRLVTAIGVENMVVVETADAVLVAPRHRAQDVKEMVQGLKEASRVEASHHRMQPKTYGSVTELADADGYRMMRATVGPGATMPSRTHEHRAERWIVVRGTGVVDIGDERFTLAAGDTAFIPAGTVHGVANPTDADLVIIQIQLGTFLADDDVDVSDEPPEVGSG